MSWSAGWPCPVGKVIYILSILCILLPSSLKQVFQGTICASGDSPFVYYFVVVRDEVPYTSRAYFCCCDIALMRTRVYFIPLLVFFTFVRRRHPSSRDPFVVNTWSLGFDFVRIYLIGELCNLCTGKRCHVYVLPLVLLECQIKYEINLPWFSGCALSIPFLRVYHRRHRHHVHHHRHHHHHQITGVVANDLADRRQHVSRSTEWQRTLNICCSIR